MISLAQMTFSPVAFDVLGERIVHSKVPLSAQQPPGLVLRSEGTLLRRVVTSAATCACAGVVPTGYCSGANLAFSI